MSTSNSKPSITNTIVLDIVISGVLPYLIYRFSVSQIGEWQALVLASVPPLLKSARELILRRRVDTIGVLALTGILLNLIGLSLGGSAQALLLRGIIFTALFGMFYLGSLLFARPLIFYIVRFLETGDTPEGIAQWHELWTTSTTFRYGMRLMTLVWGIGLLIEAMLGFVLLQMLTVEQFLLVSPFIGNGFNFGLIFWSLWYGNRIKRS
jgi:hypothetical protein